MAEPLRIGYALAPKKQKSFIRPSLITLATSKNINLVKIDPSLPLIQQGPFDCVLHKINGQDWNSQLEEYAARNPETLIIDSPDEITRLHNRVSMLETVGQLEVTRGKEEFGVPRQVVVVDHETLVDPRVHLQYFAW